MRILKEKFSINEKWSFSVDISQKNWQITLNFCFKPPFLALTLALFWPWKLNFSPNFFISNERRKRNMDWNLINRNISSLGNTSHKKNWFLSGIAHITPPSPPPPNSGKLYNFFWTSKTHYRTKGYSTIYSLRLLDSRDSQDSETPETPRLPRLLSYYFSIFLYFRFTTFSNFSNSSDSKVKVKVKGPNICYIFEKHGIQGCWI